MLKAESILCGFAGATRDKFRKRHESGAIWAEKVSTTAQSPCHRIWQSDIQHEKVSKEEEQRREGAQGKHLKLLLRWYSSVIVLYHHHLWSF